MIDLRTNGNPRIAKAFKPNGHAAPSLEEQVSHWLKESGLSSRSLPGELLRRESAYRLFCFDVDGNRKPEGDIKRLLMPVNGFAALVDPKDLKDQPKYLSPPNEPPHLYFPPSPKLDWREEVRNPKGKKLFAEGWKKAALATQYGYPCTGVEGCWGFRSKRHGLMLLPEFNDYVLEGCDVYWIPDRDRSPKAIADVLRACSAFADQMQERGARFHVVQLPLLDGRDKVGLDDCLLHYSREGRDIPAARRFLKDLLMVTGVWQDWELTDTGNSRRWVSMYGAQFRNVGRRGWHSYLNGCWREDSKLEHQEAVKEMFENMHRDAFDGGNSERASFIQKHITARRIRDAAELAKSDPRIAMTADMFDRQPLYVNCKNCTIVLPEEKNGELQIRKHDPADYLTKQVTVNYVPGASCRVFLDALMFWTSGDKHLQRTIQQLLGLSCTGITHEQVFVILYGPGQSGKSTIIETTRLILGDYAKALPSETFLVRRRGQEEERKVALLPGVRFASASETEQSGKLDENLMKLLTGEDSVAGRRLYEEQFDFKPEAKIWLRTNHQPTISGISNAIWRRVVAIPFGQIVPEKRKNVHLRDQLRQELEGIFAWMIQGYLDYVKNGFYLAPVVTKAVADYRDEQDALKQFLEDACVLDPEFRPERVMNRADVAKYQYKAGRDELYRHFLDWCGRTHRQRVAKSEFKAQLKERFAHQVEERQLRVGDKQNWYWCGVKICITSG